MATDVREARRRKILERGSDRLALIAGRLQTLPSSSSQDENATTLGSDPPSQVVIPSDPDLQPHDSNQTTVPLHGDDKASGSLLLKRDSISNVSETNAYDGGSNITPSIHQCETGIKAVRAPSSEVSGKEVHSPMVSLIDQNSSASTLSLEQHLEHQTQRHRFFTPNQISSAITASENTRLLCSITIALLVVLSYQGFPLLGSYIIKTIISFRPLYLLLLTNVTVVLARLLFYKQRGFERAAQDENEASSLNGFGWAEQVSRSLETGLVMQNALNAVFMDCSVYAIVVICGLSLAQLFN
ncbi:uncharacterized protein LOC121261197 [Juglans microcarpa x Juglans regia]|uniref:uncharacterized protein LOC121261197 n=1 Tax=Juglans microcarpa x Juglans regia TaxID=2249226 RepID=UPI001B7E024A|nr:uncharacterized protein LOC121261197 [Juglans microcarpa x Juglans regia]